MRKLICLIALLIVCTGCASVDSTRPYAYVRSNYDGYSCAINYGAAPINTLNLTRFNLSLDEATTTCNTINHALEGKQTNFFGDIKTQPR